mgnify:CR=1 FL=1
MNDKKPDNLDEFEEEMEEAEFKRPRHQFDDDIEYLDDDRGPAKSSRSGKFNFPRLSIGWLGAVLVVLVVLFLILPRGGKKNEGEDLVVIQTRLEELEKKQQDMEAINQRITALEAEAQKGIQVTDRMDQLEKLLQAKTGDLKREIDGIQAKMEKEKVVRVVEKPREEPPKKVTAGNGAKAPAKATRPSQVRYHTVQKGENLFRISLKYQLSQDELLRLNGLPKGTTIFPGQRLRVSK